MRICQLVVNSVDTIRQASGVLYVKDGNEYLPINKGQAREMYELGEPLYYVENCNE